MAKTELQRDYAFPAERVWALLSNFGDIGWAPGIERVEVIGEGIGMTRRIYMPGMEPIDEVLAEMDHGAMSFSYTIPRGIPMPVTDYRAGATVVPTGDASCRIDWWGSATPVGVSDEEAAQMMNGFYGMLLQWIQEHLER